MDPAKEVGGDVYDFFMVDSDHLALLIADVSGKGVPAALFMMATKIMLNDRTMLGASPSEILAAVNDQLSRNNVMEMFVTVWLGILEISTGKLVASNAGHEFPVIARSGGTFELIKDRHGFVLGGMPEMVYKNYTIDLKPGDRLFLYTDGVPEANNERGDRLGVDQMLNVLNRCTDNSPEKLLKTMTEGIREFVAGAEQFDDITMLSLTYYGTENDDGLTLDATIPNWETVSAFLEEKLDKMDAPMKTASQVMLAVEELYANVASYAYEGGTGKVTVRVTPSESGNGVAVKLTDSGIPYDPLQKEDPDIGLDAADRPIGGLGVFLVKKTMDDVAYERKDGKNTVVITKTWQTE
jgi:sigma-B regulation protein RsbU (phosphoserine phosphatase)